MPSLFDPLRVGALDLPNRVLMAPLTRARATDDRVPTPLMRDYYVQRASAGLILSEATSVTPMGVGYAKTPGIWSAAQVEGWRAITGPAADGVRFGAVVHGRAGAMGVYVIDLRREQSGALRGGGHGGKGGIALRMRLGEMMSIERCAVADNFAEYFCGTFLGVRQGLQREDRRAFAERKTVAVGIKGTALGG